MTGAARVVEYDRFGGPDVLVVREREIRDPGRGEVLVRVRAAALNPKDIIVQSGKYFLHRILGGTRFPKRLGYDWSGTCVATRVPGIREGDALHGMIDGWAAGACATHAIVRARELAPRPASLSWEEAAAVPLAALTALQALRDVARTSPGARVLVNGASGGVGTFAVQIAKALGATVTAVTSSRNAELVRSLGADRAIDYAAGDVCGSVGIQDVILDVFGNRSFGWARPLLSGRGVYVSTLPKGHVVRDMLLTVLSRKRAGLVRVASRADDLVTLGRWLDEGAIRPVVDRVFALDDVVRAERHLATRRARGKVVIRID